MIAFWYLPYAIATGNTFILKPSERVPLTMRYVYELLEKTGLPKGIVSLVNGGKAVVDALIDHPKVRAISFVGSTPVAKYVYSGAAANGKRAQCQGGAKNHVIILPDADMPMATQIISDSAFGCAGQRCLAVSVAVTIGEAQKTFRDSIADAASKLKVGNGLDKDVQMGPVITPQSKERVESLIGLGEKQGAKVLLDGRNSKIPRYESGNFVNPTILDDVPATPTAIRHRCLHRVGQPRAASATKLRRAILASTSESPRPWPTSPSAGGRTVSSAISTARDATPSSSIPTRKS
jgi:malonate-semialdehyde dehydrogenase (acetylating)/methylmalonate-semialdehyde dehydrogenase